MKTAAGALAVALAPGELDLVDLAGSAVVHVHFADRLFGNRCEEAAERFCSLVADLGRPVVVTLHDLPMPGNGVALFPRRVAAYAAVVAAAAAVIVSSCHEAGLLGAAGIVSPPPRVVPLPIDRRPGPVGPLPGHDSEVGVLGWIYPGKGHAEVLAALPQGMSLVALGAASPGHADLLRQLEGPSFYSTGFLSDGDLQEALLRTAVPVAPSSTISASASIGTWLEAGRRPIVIDGRWVRELEARCPGSLTIVDREKLAEAISDAAAFPEKTWLGDTPVGPTSTEVTRLIRGVCAEVVG